MAFFKNRLFASLYKMEAAEENNKNAKICAGKKCLYQPGPFKYMSQFTAAKRNNKNSAQLKKRFFIKK